MSKKFTSTLNKLIRARSGLVWVRTNEERRAEVLIAGVAQQCKFKSVQVWKASTGLMKFKDPSSQIEDLAVLCKSSFAPPSAQPDGVLEYLMKYADGPTLVIMEDLAPHIAENSPNRSQALRLLKDLGIRSQSAPMKEWVQIVVVDRGKPEDLFIPLELPLPTRKEIQAIVEGMVEGIPDEEMVKQLKDDLDQPGGMDRALDALLGLEDQQVQQALALSLAEARKIDPAILVESKKALISSPAVRWIEPNPMGLDAVGGLDALKEYLMITYQTFLDSQRYEYTPRPKGIVIAGVPGTGKSLSAKCAGTAWNLPTVQLSVGAMMGKYLGDSEQGWYKARDVVEAIAPCVLWIDEIEKAFGGFSGSAESDGGTSRRMGNEILTWLNECDKPVFIVATSNDPSALDAEFLRAGRFDDTFWVDVPNHRDRVKVLEVVGRKYKSIAPDKFVSELDIDLDAVSDACKDFTGAELEQAVINAIKRTNFERKVLDTETVISESKMIRPVIRGWSEGKLARQREWGKGARQASLPEEAKPKKATAEARRILFGGDTN